jgi:hypothetical protein
MKGITALRTFFIIIVIRNKNNLIIVNNLKNAKKNILFSINLKQSSKFKRKIRGIKIPLIILILLSYGQSIG